VSFLSPVVIYHGLGYRHLMPPALIVRPQLNGGTLGRFGLDESLRNSRTDVVACSGR